ncbi:hypothetical protein AAG570_001867 [Ranatra chinensis]|uniref:Uncharacterized protein n=1 Tax=Ranatra chinensis TaxID=642074 RepID=A0ABD0YA17_9HEMI
MKNGPEIPQTLVVVQELIFNFPIKGGRGAQIEDKMEAHKMKPVSDDIGFTIFDDASKRSVDHLLKSISILNLAEGGDTKTKKNENFALGDLGTKYRESETTKPTCPWGTSRPHITSTISYPEAESIPRDNCLFVEQHVHPYPVVIPEMLEDLSSRCWKRRCIARWLKRRWHARFSFLNQAWSEFWFKLPRLETSVRLEIGDVPGVVLVRSAHRHHQQQCGDPNYPTADNSDELKRVRVYDCVDFEKSADLNLRLELGAPMFIPLRSWGALGRTPSKGIHGS